MSYPVLLTGIFGSPLAEDPVLEVGEVPILMVAFLLSSMVPDDNCFILIVKCMLRGINK